MITGRTVSLVAERAGEPTRMSPGIVYVPEVIPQEHPIIRAIQDGDLERVAAIVDRALGDPIPDANDRLGIASASLPRYLVVSAPDERHARALAQRAADAGALAESRMLDAGASVRAAMLTGAATRSIARGGNGTSAEDSRDHDARHCYRGARACGAPLSRPTVGTGPLSSRDGGVSPSPSKQGKSHARLRALRACEVHAATLDAKLARQADRRALEHARDLERVALLDALRADYQVAKTASERRALLTRAGSVGRAYGVDPRTARYLVRGGD